MIIFEGPDHVGKTTSARSIERLGELQYRHMDCPGEDFDWYSGWDIRDNIVQDRFHLGSVVYGILCGFHNCGFSLSNFVDLIHKIHERCFTIIMIDDYHGLSSRFGEKEELYEDIGTVLEGYEIIIDQASLFQIPLYDVVWNISHSGYPTEEILRKWIQIHERRVLKRNTMPI